VSFKVPDSFPLLQSPTMRSGRLLGLFLVLAAAVLLAGCSQRKTEHSVSATSGDTLANGLPRALASQLSPWLTMWRAAIPGMEADSLRPGGVGPALRVGHDQPLSDFESLSQEEAAAFEVLTARSPDGRYRLVFDRYQAISEEDGAVEISGEPDSAPLLIDDRQRLVQTFEFCGTPCGYDWGCWVDSTRFALGGWAEVDAAQDSLWGVLGIYSLADSTLARYFTRSVSSEEYARYREAWRAWVTHRYRAWKPVTAARGN
jgi:hypothetical protein